MRAQKRPRPNQLAGEPSPRRRVPPSERRQSPSPEPPVLPASQEPSQFESFPLEVPTDPPEEQQPGDDPDARTEDGSRRLSLLCFPVVRERSQLSDRLHLPAATRLPSELGQWADLPAAIAVAIHDRWARISSLLQLDTAVCDPDTLDCCLAAINEYRGTHSTDQEAGVSDQERVMGQAPLHDEPVVLLSQETISPQAVGDNDAAVAREDGIAPSQETVIPPGRNSTSISPPHMSAMSRQEAREGWGGHRQTLL
jgi:hypothetical protein